MGGMGRQEQALRRRSSPARRWRRPPARRTAPSARGLPPRCPRSRRIDAAGLAARYPRLVRHALGYDPLTAANLSLIRGSQLGLTAAEEEVLARNGFVISDRQKFPTFAYGYASIYADDLPLFISADSILYAVHRSYDEMLKQLEISLAAARR